MPSLSPLKFLLFNSPHSLALLDPDLTTFLSSKHVAHTPKTTCLLGSLPSFSVNPFTLPPSQPPFAGPELGLVIWLPSYFPHYGPCFPAVCGWHFLSVYLPLVFISTLSSLPSPSPMDASIPHLSCFLDDILTSLDVSLCQVSPIVLPLLGTPQKIRLPHSLVPLIHGRRLYLDPPVPRSIYPAFLRCGSRKPSPLSADL